MHGSGFAFGRNKLKIMKIKIIIFLCILVVMNSCSTYNQVQESTLYHNYDGILESHYYKCSTCQFLLRKVYIYLPKDYYESDTNFPVIYLLHGANGNEESWIRNGHVLERIDSLYSSHSIGKCIYVFPNTNSYYSQLDYGNSRPKKSIEAYFALKGNVEYNFLNDLVRYIDNNYRTSNQKSYRGICGLSLGGLQSLYISANNPQEFGHIGLFSPLIYPPFSLGKHSNIYSHLQDKLLLQFNSNPQNYLIMVGEDDPYFSSSYFYCKLLESLDLNFEFIITHGSHTWENWDKYSVYFLERFWEGQNQYN